MSYRSRTAEGVNDKTHDGKLDLKTSICLQKKINFQSGDDEAGI